MTFVHSSLQNERKQRTMKAATGTPVTAPTPPAVPPLTPVPSNFERIVRLMRPRGSTPRTAESPERDVAQLVETGNVDLGGITWDPVSNHFFCFEGHEMVGRSFSGGSADPAGIYCDRCAAGVVPPGRSDLVPWCHCGTCGVDVCRRCLGEVREEPRMHKRCARCATCGTFLSIEEASAHRCNRRRKLESLQQRVPLRTVRGVAV